MCLRIFNAKVKEEGGGGSEQEHQPQSSSSRLARIGSSEDVKKTK